MMFEALVGRAWQWIGPAKVDCDGEEYFELRIRELPDFLVVGRTRAEVLSEALPALRIFLDSYAGGTAPVPTPARPANTWVVRIHDFAAALPIAAFVKGPGSSGDAAASLESETRRAIA